MSKGRASPYNRSVNDSDHDHVFCPGCGTPNVLMVSGHGDRTVIKAEMPIPEKLQGSLVCHSCLASLTMHTAQGPQTVQVSGTDSEEVATVAKRLIGQIHEEHERVRPMAAADSDASNKREHDRERLELQKLRLEREYELARMGLGKTVTTTGMAIVSVLITMLLAFGAAMWGTRAFLSGTEIVAIVIVVAIGLVAFAAMVFGRAARLKARISQTDKELEMVLGEDVRLSDTQ
jgi:hypothetical protein